MPVISCETNAKLLLLGFHCHGGKDYTYELLSGCGGYERSLVAQMQRDPIQWKMNHKDTVIKIHRIAKGTPVQQPEIASLQSLIISPFQSLAGLFSPLRRVNVWFYHFSLMKALRYASSLFFGTWLYADLSGDSKLLLLPYVTGGCKFFNTRDSHMKLIYLFNHAPLLSCWHNLLQQAQKNQTILWCVCAHQFVYSFITDWNYKVCLVLRTPNDGRKFSSSDVTSFKLYAQCNFVFFTMTEAIGQYFNRCFCR